MDDVRAFYLQLNEVLCDFVEKRLLEIFSVVTASALMLIYTIQLVANAAGNSPTSVIVAICKLRNNNLQ